jgi:hypothetical protein
MPTLGKKKFAYTKKGKAAYKAAKVKESIFNTYRRLGTLLTEEPDPKHWNSWDLDPKNPKKGKLYSQKAGSQEVEGGNTPVPVKKRRTRVTTPADDLGIEGTKTHHTTTSNAVTTTNKKTGAWHTAVRTMDGTPLRIKRSTSVKGKIKNDDGTTKQVNVKNFPTSHSSMKESIKNRLVDLITEAGNMPPERGNGWNYSSGKGMSRQAKKNFKKAKKAAEKANREKQASERGNQDTSRSDPAASPFSNADGRPHPITTPVVSPEDKAKEDEDKAREAARKARDDASLKRELARDARLKQRDDAEKEEKEKRDKLKGVMNLFASGKKLGNKLSADPNPKPTKSVF